MSLLPVGGHFVPSISLQNDLSPGLMLIYYYVLVWTIEKLLELTATYVSQPSVERGAHNHARQAVIIQHYLGSFKNSSNPKITSAPNSELKRC
jgi:hypothetical protein